MPQRRQDVPVIGKRIVAIERCAKRRYGHRRDLIGPRLGSSYPFSQLINVHRVKHIIGQSRPQTGGPSGALCLFFSRAVYGRPAVAGTVDATLITPTFPSIAIVVPNSFESRCRRARMRCATSGDAVRG